jgi:hypothetical protein
MLRSLSEPLGVRAVMLVPEGKARADAGRFKEETDLLEFSTPYDMAPCIANDCGGLICVIYAGHFDIPVSMISVIFLFRFGGYGQKEASLGSHKLN